jgi:hypothetical protein
MTKFPTQLAVDVRMAGRPARMALLAIQNGRAQAVVHRRRCVIHVSSLSVVRSGIVAASVML